MGVTAGVSDYIVLRPRGGFNFAVIEMKRRTPKHKPDDAQVEWLKERRDDGGFVCIAHGADAALYALECYLNNKTL